MEKGAGGVANGVGNDGVGGVLVEDGRDVALGGGEAGQGLDRDVVASALDEGGEVDLGGVDLGLVDVEAGGDARVDLAHEADVHAVGGDDAGAATGMEPGRRGGLEPG